MKKTLLTAAMVLLIACGPSPSEEKPTNESTSNDESVSYELPVADVYISVNDSIGVDIGDSNYVFGAIVGARYTPGGEIAVLDIQKYCISFYTQEGEFVKSIGRQGSGPGEFQLVTAFTFCPDGGIVVADAMARALMFFDSKGEYTGNLTGFFPTSPQQVICVDERALVGMKPEFEQNEDGMFMGFIIARWEEGKTEPSAEYYSKMSPFDPEDMSSIAEDVAFFGATEDGMVFASRLSTEEYSFTAYSPGGEELFVVTDENFEKVEKTPEAIELEIELVNARMIQQGMPPEMANWEPDPYQYAIESIQVDSADRVWVQRGTERTPVFDVYDIDGNLLFTAALDAGETSETWQVVISGDGFLAFDAAPEYYPVLYYGELPR